jgi:hypothetical protein
MWNPFKQKTNDLADLLSVQRNREDLLGVSPTQMPTPETILRDSTRLVQNANTEWYKAFAQEAWARAISYLEIIEDPKTSTEQMHFARGAYKATLDLLRLSYQAKAIKQTLEKDVMNAPLPR